MGPRPLSAVAPFTILFGTSRRALDTAAQRLNDAEIANLEQREEPKP